MQTWTFEKGLGLTFVKVEILLLLGKCRRRFYDLSTVLATPATSQQMSPLKIPIQSSPPLWKSPPFDLRSNVIYEFLESRIFQLGLPLQGTEFTVEVDSWWEQHRYVLKRFYKSVLVWEVYGKRTYFFSLLCTLPLCFVVITPAKRNKAQHAGKGGMSRGGEVQMTGGWGGVRWVGWGGADDRSISIKQATLQLVRGARSCTATNYQTITMP